MTTLAIRVRTTPLPLSEAAHSALKHLEQFQWVLFTSKNAVEIFIKEIKKRQLPATLRVAAVGPQTAAALRGRGYRVDIVPAVHTVDAMIKSLGEVAGARILFPRSAVAPTDAPRALRARGARVRVIPIYTTRAVPLITRERRALLGGTYDTLAFSSPSGITGFLKQFTRVERSQLLTLSAECIGPTTAAAAKLTGFKRISVAPVL